jgi:hypothetical protein
MRAPPVAELYSNEIQTEILKPMKTRRRTEIVFERERTILYSERYPRQRLWCAQCAADVEMITVFEAARLAGVSTYTIHARANQGELHQWTNTSGVLLVCLNSLTD